MALYAFDGTWNDSSVADSQRDLKEDTNVYRFTKHYSKNVAYIDGVGTRYGILGKAFGGMTGLGWKRRVKEQFEILKKHFKKGDTEIDVIGYSRGATTARMFLHHLENNYEKIIGKNGSPLTSPPKVRFLGLFDTVASLGIPWTEKESGFDRIIPEFVQHTYHAMALDESRETFGIERCLGDRRRITEVWFRGGHGDIGGNATYENKNDKLSNKDRSNITLTWMLNKAKACDLPISKDEKAIDTNLTAPVTDKGGAKYSLNNIGKVGTLSRRIHVGDLVHYTVEDTELTFGLNGHQLRRINVPTRIENKHIELKADSFDWIPLSNKQYETDNIVKESNLPSIVQLSTRRYPFDVLPARTWQSWFDHWNIQDPGIDYDREGYFWAPSFSDRALAWEIYVELHTRIAIQPLEDHEGDDLTALSSIHLLFPTTRECLRKHGVTCSNAGTLITVFLNDNIRAFLSKWHKISIEDKWKDEPGVIHPKFRKELKEIQPVLKTLSEALSHLADAKLD